jgi:drug/metabolite transporter (DMT)-like permease
MQSTEESTESLGTGLAYIAWFWLLDRVSLMRLGAALFLVPVVGIVAAIVAGERPGGVELAGIAAMLVGIGLVSVGGPSAPSVEEPARQTA